MIVYRMEDRDGSGPYRGAWAREYSALFDDGDAARHPCPATDNARDDLSAVYDDAAWRYGFETMESLERWFDPPRRAYLERHGFTIQRYSVDPANVLFGDHQIAFRIAGATKEV